MVKLHREVGELRAENTELRRENAELRQQVNDLPSDVGYWKSRHPDAVERHRILQAELNEAKAGIQQLKAEHCGKKTEKQSRSDRTNPLDDPTEQMAPKEAAWKSGTEAWRLLASASTHSENRCSGRRQSQ